MEWYENLPNRSSDEDLEYFREIQGWVESCGQNGFTVLKTVDMVIYNWVYEFGSLACTSIIWWEGHGTNSSGVKLASNLDYSDFDVFVPLTRKGVFLRNSEVLFEANLILGFFGFTRVFKRLADGSIL